MSQKMKCRTEKSSKPRFKSELFDDKKLDTYSIDLYLKEGFMVKDSLYTDNSIWNVLLSWIRTMEPDAGWYRRFKITLNKGVTKKQLFVHLKKQMAGSLLPDPRKPELTGVTLRKLFEDAQSKRLVTLDFSGHEIHIPGNEPSIDRNPWRT